MLPPWFATDMPSAGAYQLQINCCHNESSCWWWIGSIMWPWSRSFICTPTARSSAFSVFFFRNLRRVSKGIFWSTSQCGFFLLNSQFLIICTEYQCSRSHRSRWAWPLFSQESFDPHCPSVEPTSLIPSSLEQNQAIRPSETPFPLHCLTMVFSLNIILLFCLPTTKTV